MSVPILRPKPERFPSMDIHAADKECGKRRRLHTRVCPACKSQVMLHCDECLIQVTGCICVMVDRFGHEEALRQLTEQYGMRQAKKRLKRAGLWTPGSDN